MKPIRLITRRGHLFKLLAEDHADACDVLCGWAESGIGGFTWVDAHIMASMHAHQMALEKLRAGQELKHENVGN